MLGNYPPGFRKGNNADPQHFIVRSLTISFTRVVTIRCKRADIDTKKSNRFHLEQMPRTENPSQIIRRSDWWRAARTGTRTTLLIVRLCAEEAIWDLQNACETRFSVQCHHPHRFVVFFTTLFPNVS